MHVHVLSGELSVSNLTNLCYTKVQDQSLLIRVSRHFGRAFLLLRTSPSVVYGHFVYLPTWVDLFTCLSFLGLC